MNKIQAEIQRLKNNNPNHTEYSGKMKVSLTSSYGTDIEPIIDKVSNILLVILENSENQWPTLKEWEQLFPTWFIEKFAADMTKEEAEKWLKKWRKMSLKKKAKIKETMKWSLPDWLYWFEPQNREWEYHSISNISKDSFNFNILVDGWPFPHGAIDWLLKNCGVSSISID